MVVALLAEMGVGLQYSRHWEGQVVASQSRLSSGVTESDPGSRLER